MYLSSHPLDDYSVIVRYVCNTPINKFLNLAELGMREFVAGGMVTSVQNLTTAKGKPFGKFKIEDYSGECEFALFGKDYEQFRPFLYPGYFLMLRGSVRPHAFREGELEVKFGTMTQLQDVGEDVIKEMNLSIFLEDLTADMRQEFVQRLKKSKGKTHVTIRVCDGRTGVAMTFYPKKLKVKVTQELLDYFDDNSIIFRLSAN